MRKVVLNIISDINQKEKEIKNVAVSAMIVLFFDGLSL